ncbi:MAG: hypothetical protein RIM23_27480 [Coleofasciculus sp. G3-WIS-01]|uniref:hypothetical protein n=1 Tax=Coleofasciculus sp. G3-WIS-01 TaxID=3069528 RepID=UPI0032F5DB9C
MYKILIVSALTLVTFAGNAVNGIAQTSPRSPASSPDVDPGYYIDLNRAKNLARQAAERINGGLGRYRAEAAMHGPVQDAPYIENNNGTVTFTFKGRPPGATSYTVETSVTVNQNNGTVTVNYNRPIGN